MGIVAENDYDLDVGTKVRYVLDKKSFAKVRHKISKGYYTIDSIEGNNYVIIARDGTTKKIPRSRLVLVNDNQNVPQADTIEEYNDELAEIASMKIETILTRRNEFLAAGNLDSLRGQILGTNRPIRQDRFVREVREFYRNGQDLEQYIHIGDTEFTRTLCEIPQLEQDTKEMNRVKNELITSLERVETFFNQKIPVVYSNGTSVVKLDKISVNDGKVTSNGTETLLDEDRNKIEAYTRFKYNQIKELSNIASVVVMERANAYKDKVRMTEEILTKAIISGKMSE